MLSIHCCTLRFSCLMMLIRFVTGSCLERAICRVSSENIKQPDLIQEPKKESKNDNQRREFKQAFYEADKDYYWYTKQGEKVPEGPILSIFKTFQEKRNIRLIPVIPEPYRFGVKGDGKFYDGEMGLVQNGSVDISSNIFFITDDRYEFADYTTPIVSSPFCIMMRRAPLMPFAQVLVLPYRALSWAAILGSLFAAAFMWYLNVRLQSRPSGQHQVDYSPLGSAFIHVAQVALTGGCTSNPRFTSHRLTLASLLLFSLVLGNAYQGQLLGFMTAPPHLAEPQTIEETARFLKRLFAFSILNSIFEAEDTSAVLKVLRKKIELVKPESLHQLIRDGTIGYTDGAIVCKECFEFFSEMKELTKDGKPFLYLMPECLNSPGHQSFLISKNSSITDEFSSFAMRIMEGGFYWQWVHLQRNQMYANDLMVPPTRSGPMKDPEGLRFDQVEGALFLLGIGICVAGITFIMELLFYYFIQTS